MNMSDREEIKVNMDEPEGAACLLRGLPLVWEFECSNCHHAFTTDVPSGPKEERALRCPQCGCDEIRRTNIDSMEPIYCGG